MTSLIELDSLELLVLVDDELDPFSACHHPAVKQSGGVWDISMRSPDLTSDERGSDVHELRMDNICCSAHGYSLMVTGTCGDERHTILFDAGPEESAWERNVRRLGAKIGDIEMITLSHWHRDHSGGMLKAVEMINEARKSKDDNTKPIVVDLHPDRPDYRGGQAPGMPVLSLEADPTFEQIEAAGGIVEKCVEPHAVLSSFFVVSGEIPRHTNYETGFKGGVRFNSKKGQWEPDELLMDERFLMCRLKDQGIVMITGCGHSGVVNSAKHALELCKGNKSEFYPPLYCVAGGFHLADGSADKVQASVQDLKELGVQIMLAGHCTGWRAKFEMERQMPGRLVPSFVGCSYRL